MYAGFSVRPEEFPTPSYESRLLETVGLSDRSWTALYASTTPEADSLRGDTGS